MPVKALPTPARQRRAFTLIELLVVIAIIGVLSSMLFVLFGIAHKHSDRTRNDALLQKVHAGLLDYRGIYNTFPPTPSDPLAGNGLGVWLCTPSDSVTVTGKESDVLADVLTDGLVVGGDILDHHPTQRPLLYVFTKPEPSPMPTPPDFDPRDPVPLPDDLMTDAADLSLTAYEGFEGIFELWTYGPDGKADLLRNSPANADNRGVTQPFGSMGVY